MRPRTLVEEKKEKERLIQLFASSGKAKAVSDAPPEEEGIYEGPEPGFGARAAASFSRTPEGQVNILRSLGYAAKVVDGVPFVRRRPEGVLGESPSGWKVLDPEGAEWGDIADLAGDAPATILSTLGGISGFTATPLGGAALASLGGTLGEALRQQTAGALGSQEDIDVGNIAREAALSGPADLAARLGIGAAARLTGPFAFGKTRRVKREVLDPVKKFDVKYGTQLGKSLPARARSQSPLLARTEGRIAVATGTGDLYTDQVREPFREEVGDLAQRIIGKFGIESPPMRATRPLRRKGVDPETGEKLPLTSEEIEGVMLGRTVREAAEETVEARRREVDDLYEVARESLVLPTGDRPMFNAVIDRTKEAMKAARARSGSAVSGPLGRQLRAQFNQLDESLNQVTTYEELDAFRRALGTLLDAKGAEGFTSLGLDRHMKSIYGALREDLRSTVERGFREGVGGIPPGQKIPKRLEEILDIPAQRAITAEKVAAESFEDLIALDATTARRIMADPDRVGNLVSALTGEKATAEQIIEFKRHIGAIESETGLRATVEGAEAWRQAQSALMARILGGSILKDTDIVSAFPISGNELLKQLKKYDSDDYEVLAEFLGKELTGEMYDFARVLKQIDPEERSFVKIKREMEKQEWSGFFEMVKTTLQGIFDQIAAPAITSKHDLPRRWLAEGLPGGEIVRPPLNILSRIGAQYGKEHGVIPEFSQGERPVRLVPQVTARAMSTGVPLKNRGK
jgi:hypothetical protein